MFLSKSKYRLLLAAMLTVLSLPARDTISLAGSWQLRLQDRITSVVNAPDFVFTDNIQLPGTLDEAQKGQKSEPTNSTHHLQRRYSHYGKAWYAREITIPESWQGKLISLKMERTRPTKVWINGVSAGENKLISAPQFYELTKYLKTGKNRIVIEVDNGQECGLPREIASSHMWSDDTQTNWNGILGEISLTALNTVHFSSLKTIPDAGLKQLKICVTIENSLNETADYQIQSIVSNGSKKLLVQKQNMRVKPGQNTLEFVLPLTKNVKLWDEYSPALYTLAVSLHKDGAKTDEAKSTFGLRTFKSEGKHFSINGRNIFLRGRHDACVFPLTGYAPMNEETWISYFSILKKYGFNHVRFHSWCPPEAAFAVADRMGFYLQPELPYWGNIADDPSDPVRRFLLAEGKAVLDAFAHHPSFVMFSTGNELWGSIDGMKALTEAFRQHDDRPLFALGSNFHLGWLGEQGGEDFLVSCRVGGQNDAQYEPHVRSSFSFADAADGGLLNASYPNTRMNFEKGAAMTTKPVVSHETGQFQMLPHPNELPLYTGILSPRNLEIFIERFYAKVGKENYQRYYDAAAALSLLCYKADLEMMHRTGNLAGYQMLDIQDFPGQGTALVGILNAHMQSKGVISEEEFRSWNNDIMPLWLADGFTFYDKDIVKSEVKISNFSKKTLKNKTLRWKLQTEKGEILLSGKIKINAPSGTLSDAFQLLIQLPAVEKAVFCRLEIQIQGTKYKNTYPLWIYPAKKELPTPENDLKIFEKADSALFAHLANGGKGLLIPAGNSHPDQTVGGLFTSDYWNYSMFKSISENAKKPVSPGTMGLLIQNEHRLFDHFPTQTHSNWQWWPAVRNSHPLIIDRAAGKINPIVESIDNVERVHRLATIFECKVDKGKLLVCMSDLRNSLHYKENVQLYSAIITYLNSNSFNPADSISADLLKTLFTEKSAENNIQGVRNISYDE